MGSAYDHVLGSVEHLAVMEIFPRLLSLELNGSAVDIETEKGMKTSLSEVCLEFVWCSRVCLCVYV